jgi:hypothetical protein
MEFYGSFGSRISFYVILDKDYLEVLAIKALDFSNNL